METTTVREGRKIAGHQYRDIYVKRIKIGNKTCYEFAVHHYAEPRENVSKSLEQAITKIDQYLNGVWRTSGGHRIDYVAVDGNIVRVRPDGVLVNNATLVGAE
jgi:hypothetical protein